MDEYDLHIAKTLMKKRKKGQREIVELTLFSKQAAVTVMTIQLKPETERIVQKALKSGHFRTVDDLIVESVHAWREKFRQVRSARPKSRNTTLSEFLMESPLAGSDLNLDRDKNPGRTIEL